jgi:hypothetical protein
VSWDHRFFDPIVLSDRKLLVTLRDAARYITKLPRAEHDATEWQAAMEALLLVAEQREERCTASGTREELALAVVICPSGIFVSSPHCKNISLHPSGKSSLQVRAIPPHHKGRIAIVTDAGCGCGGRGSVLRATGLQGG